LPFEEKCKETIKFNVFAHRKYCTKHVDAEISSGADGDYCSICQHLTEEEKATFKKHAAIKTKKLRVLTSLPMDEFYAVDGHFHTTIREYLFHQLIVTCQSPSFFNKYRKEQFLSEEGKGIIMTVRDHADKWKMCANREIQTEHFVEDQALGIEGAYLEMHVNIGQNGETEQRSMFYSIITDEKAQIAATVHENLQMTINHLLDTGRITTDKLKKIFDVCDGCGAQYRSGSVLYLLSKICFEFKIVYDRAIQAPGHGKGIVDALNGKLKHVLDTFFTTHIKNPEDPEYD